MVGNGWGLVVIEKPEGEEIYVDGRLVGTVGAAITQSGTLKVDSVPQGAKIYLKKTAGYVYHGLTPQTLKLAAGPIPYVLRLEKDDFADSYDFIYILPQETTSKTYYLEREWAKEPEVEATGTVTIRSSPPAELFLYMEGAEGFVSYGTTPKTLTLKATRGMWVAMDEAKRARDEGRMLGEEASKFDEERRKRDEMVRLAKEAYEEAKAAREGATELLETFREIYNEFLSTYNTFLSQYNDFMRKYNAAVGEARAALEGEKAEWDEQKRGWNEDRVYWTDLLKYYEERVKVLREFEQQMKDEYEEAKLRAKAPYWMVTPGLLGTTWRLKLTKNDYQEVIDRFTVMPGEVYTKDYALAKALDVTTPESLAPLVISSPPPVPPEAPYAHTWLYIVCWDPGVAINAVWIGGAEPPIKERGAYHDWHADHYSALGTRVCGYPNRRETSCKDKYLTVPPGKHIFYVSLYKTGGGTYWARQQIIQKYTLNLAPGETRYVIAEYVTEGTNTSALATKKAPGLCPWAGIETYGDKMAKMGYTLCGRPRMSTIREWKGELPSLTSGAKEIKGYGEPVKKPSAVAPKPYYKAATTPAKARLPSYKAPAKAAAKAPAKAAATTPAKARLPSYKAPAKAPLAPYKAPAKAPAKKKKTWTSSWMW